MGGDDIFVLVLVAGFAVVSFLALRGRRDATSSGPVGDDDV